MGVFVSYSHLDRDKMLHTLETLGKVPELEIWCDKNLCGGEQFIDEIADQIMAQEYFFFLLSKNSVNSTFCRQELTFAYNKGRKIIAVVIEDVALPAGVDFCLTGIHHIFYSEEDSFDEEVARSFKKSVAKAGHSFHNDHRPTEKYFVEKANIKLIDKLIKDEQNGAYSVCFEAENAVLIGLAYEQGIHTDIDLKKAQLYYHVAAHRGNLDGQYLYAALMAELNPEKEAEYIKQMEEAAEGGSVYALTHYGDLCNSGDKGVPYDRAKAVEYWRKAADKSFPTALYYMGYAYHTAMSVDRDDGLALMYALLAIEREFPRGYRLMGYLHYFGNFLEKDYDKAIEYYEKAVEHSDYLSLCYIGNVYYNVKERRDNDKAFRYYAQAAEFADRGEIISGLPYSRVAVCKYYGHGTEQDIVAAADFAFKGAARNHKNSIDNIALYCSQIEDESVRIEYLERAAELNYPQAEWRLGLNFESKKTDEGYQKAIEYYKAGAEKGCLDCVCRLLGLFSKVLSSDETKKYNDSVTAIKYYQRFFALSRSEGFEAFRKKTDVGRYYYGYAYEYYDSADKTNLETLSIYLRLAMDESPNYMGTIASFSHNRYFKKHLRETKLCPEVEEGIKLMDMCWEYWDKWVEWFKTLKPADHKLNFERLDDLASSFRYLMNVYAIPGETQDLKKMGEYSVRLSKIEDFKKQVNNA